MLPLVSERVREFGDRHEVIDWLRSQRELGEPFTPGTETIQALLQEVDLLQIVAHSAEHVAAFGCGEAPDEPLTQLRNSLRRWKE